MSRNFGAGVVVGGMRGAQCDASDRSFSVVEARGAVIRWSLGRQRLSWFNFELDWFCYVI
jgi:hypothetical protein